MYPPELVLPMEAELTSNGFKAINNPKEIDEIIGESGTTLVVVNSVCGCAAGSARPGVIQSLEGDKKPKNLVTVFAGVDRQATDQARMHMLPYPPSSPSMALFKDGKLVSILERHHIEGRTPEMITSHLQMVYEEFC